MESVAPPSRAVGQWRLNRFLAAIAAVAVLVSSYAVNPLLLCLAIATVATVALVLRMPVAGLCLLALSVPWGGGYPFRVGGYPMTSTDICVAVLAGVWLAIIPAKARLARERSVWNPFVLLFIAAIGASATQATDSHAAISEIIKWIELLVVYNAGLRFITSRRDFHLVIAAMVVGGVSQALLGLYQFALHAGPEAFVHGTFLRAFGSFDQPNPYAGYLNMVVPVALAMTIHGETPKVRVRFGACSVVILLAIGASQSRGAILATALAVMTVLACSFDGVRNWSKLSVLGGILAGWLATFGLLPVGPFTRILSAVGLGDVAFGHVTNANFSAVERAAHWLAGVRMFASHPLLGIGIGNYSASYPAYHPRGWYATLAHAHNYYINIAAEAGIIGLAAYSLLVGSALCYSYAVMRRLRSSVYKAAVLGAYGALVATSFHNLFDVLYVHGLVALLGLLMAFVPVCQRAWMQQTEGRGT